jgi:hypothetical protein
VQVFLHWGLNQMDILTAVADNMQEQHADEDSQTLDMYCGTNYPGQHWACYRSRALKEPSDHKNLKDRLEDLLRPSTTEKQLRSVTKETKYCPYLRFTDKTMDMSVWLVENEVSEGAHFPLCVFTNNARSRSRAKAFLRSKKRSWKHHDQYAGNSKVMKACTQETCEPAVAEAPASSVAEAPPSSITEWIRWHRGLTEPLSTGTCAASSSTEPTSTGTCAASSSQACDHL